MSLAPRVSARISGVMSSRSSPGGTTNGVSGSVGFSSRVFSRPSAFTSSARCTSPATLRDSVQPGIRVSSVLAVQCGWGWKPMIPNSTGTFRSSRACWMAAFTPWAKAEKITGPSGWYLRISASQSPRKASRRANRSRVR